MTKTDGNWTSVDGNGQAVPAALLLENIAAYLQANYPNQVATEISIEHNQIEIGLVNELDLYFDQSGNFLRADY